MREKKRSDSDAQNALRILEALNGVDEELLQRSEARRRPYWTYGGAVAACLAIAAAGALTWNALRMSSGSGEAPDTALGELDYRPLADLSSGAVKESQQMASGANPGGANPKENAEDGTKDSDHEDGTEDSGRGDGSEDTAENTPESNVESAEAVRKEEKQKNGFDGISDSEMELCEYPLDTRKELTQKEARGEAVFGAYIPETLPAGYTFENAWSSEEGITVSWTRKMDNIMISVSAVVPEDMVTADLEKPETYDERLYEIPYAETVPGEYREVFQDPVFLAEDLSLEVVRSRMKSVEDAGDTNTPRGMFSVLYPEGILVRFNGRGTADEIWSMFCSVNK